MLRRYLRSAAASPDEIDGLSFADLIRTGNAQGLLRAEWSAWRNFREMRTRTSHTYDEKSALDVVAGIPSFSGRGGVSFGGTAKAACMTRPVLDVQAEHRAVLLNVLDANLPPGGKVWVFGSRATGRARRYSDLDLLIDAGRRLSIDEAAVLREALEESDLPYRVDIVDWHATDEGFRRLIDAERVPLVPDAPAEPGNGLDKASH
jgi:predicted nucleotidyltransferase